MLTDVSRRFSIFSALELFSSQMHLSQMRLSQMRLSQMQFHSTWQVKRNSEILEKGGRSIEKRGRKVYFDCWRDWSQCSVLQIESDWGETWTKKHNITKCLSFVSKSDIAPWKDFFNSPVVTRHLVGWNGSTIDEKGEGGRVLFHHRCGGRWKKIERLEGMGEWKRLRMRGRQSDPLPAKRLCVLWL